MLFNVVILKHKERGVIMAQISLRIDDEVKKNAEQACADIGLSMASAINIYLKKLGNERRIPFEVSADPFYSLQNIARLKNSVTAVKEGKSKLTEHELFEV